MDQATADLPERLDAAQAQTAAARAAGGLAAAGCRPGDRVAISVSSSPSLLCLVLGALCTGVVPVLLSPALTAGERRALVDDAGPVLDLAGPDDLEAVLGGEPVPLAPCPLTRPMLYTSGTTGRPKGVWVGVWDHPTAVAHQADERQLFQPRPDDLHLVCAPTYHSAPLRAALVTLGVGGSVAVVPRFEAGAVLEALRRLRPTTTFMVPTHLQRLLAHPALEPEERFDSLRLLVHAGSACPPALKRAVLERVNPGVALEFYGSTEGQFTACSDTEWLERPGTVGRARPGRRLAIEPDDTGEAPAISADGHPLGVIWCHAPPFARFEYWGQPEATEAAWRGDAFSVGDLGWLDQEGYLYLAGRRGDLIITGGVNVYPAEIEAALAGAEGVTELAVFGVPDPEWGERVCAAVVAGPGFDVGWLARLAAERLAPPKRPKQYVVVDELPHTASGKLLRRQLGAHAGLDPGDGVTGAHRG